MTNPLSAESQARQDSIFDDNLETEYQPHEKRARINLSTTTTSTKDSVLLNCGTTAEGRENRQGTVSSETASEIGNTVGTSSRMNVFRRGGRTQVQSRFIGPDQADGGLENDSDLMELTRWDRLGLSVKLNDDENGSSGGEDDKQTRSRTDLEWLWDEESKSRACTLTNHNTEVRFHLDYSCGTAAARGTQPICEGQHYWEIKMVSAVYGTDMMIGLGTTQVNLGKFSHLFCSMLGIDNNGDSCGLSYTGRFHNGGMSKMYCSKYGQGTVIGVHLDMWFGTITFFKNGKCLGVAGKGLLGKEWHPMVSSTAARSSMRLVKARSFPSSLQFWCCNALRKAIPPDLNVLEVLDFPPGLRNFLEDNLSWLLGAHNTRVQVECKNKGTQTVLSCTAVVHRQRMREQLS